MKKKKYNYAMWGAQITGNVPEHHINNYLKEIMVDVFSDIEKWDLRVNKVSIYKYNGKYIIKAWPDKEFIPFGSDLDERRGYGLKGTKGQGNGQRYVKAEVDINDVIIADVMMS
jgi:hypothetical protein